MWRSGSPTSELWGYTYNDLNQLTQRSFVNKPYLLAAGATYYYWDYTYDANGNLTEMAKKNVSLVQLEKWLYTWNPRDQLTKVEKRTGTGSGTYAGKVEYKYCLSCDGALAHRIEYDTTVSTTIDSWKRYEFDGLKLLRVDERYDDDNPANGIDSGDPWRTVEASTHGPGIIGNLLAKRVYTHTNNDDTPDDTDDYYYAYDHIGNVYMVFDDDGNEVYHFSQDAFGNELSIGSYTGSSWTTASASGISEHQTGKWVDGFSGLYFFNARWYDSVVGRWMSRVPTRNYWEGAYLFVYNNPNKFQDSNGQEAGVMCLAWGCAVCEPTPVGECVMTAVTVVAIGVACIRDLAAPPPPPPPPNVDCIDLWTRCTGPESLPRSDTWGRTICTACLGECLTNGFWPYYKCPNIAPR